MKQIYFCLIWAKLLTAFERPTDWRQEKQKKTSLPHHFEDHNYSNYDDTSLTIDQQNADDIGWASTTEHIIENIEKKHYKKTQRKNSTHKSFQNQKIRHKKDGYDSWKKMQIRRQFINRRHK